MEYLENQSHHPSLYKHSPTPPFSSELSVWAASFHPLRQVAAVTNGAVQGATSAT